MNEKEDSPAGTPTSQGHVFLNATTQINGSGCFDSP